MILFLIEINPIRYIILKQVEYIYRLSSILSIRAMNVREFSFTSNSISRTALSLLPNLSFVHSRVSKNTTKRFSSKPRRAEELPIGNTLSVCTHCTAHGHSNDTTGIILYF